MGRREDLIKAARRQQLIEAAKQKQASENNAVTQPNSNEPGIVSRAFHTAIEYPSGIARVLGATTLDALRKMAGYDDNGIVQGDDYLRALLMNAPKAKEYMDRMNVEQNLGIPKEIVDQLSALSTKRGKNDLKGKIYLGNDTEGNPIIKTPREILESISSFGADVAGGEGLAKALRELKNLSPALRSSAEKLIISHLKPNLNQKLYQGREGLKEIAGHVLDTGATKSKGFIPGTNIEQTAKNLEALLGKLGPQKEVMLSEAEAAGKTVNPEVVAERLQSEVIDPLNNTSAGKPVVKRMSNVKNEFLDQYAPGLNENKPVVVTTPGKEGFYAEPTQTSNGVVVTDGYPESSMVDESGLLTQNIPGKNKSIGKYNNPGQFDMTYNPAPPAEYVHGTPGKIETIQPGRTQYDPVYNPKPKFEMKPSQIDLEKQMEQRMANYKNAAPIPEPDIAADRDWARILKEETEKVVDNPVFPEVNRQYGLTREATNWANRAEMLPDTRKLGGDAGSILEWLARSRGTTGTANILNSLSKLKSTGPRLGVTSYLNFGDTLSRPDIYPAWMKLYNEYQGK